MSNTQGHEPIEDCFTIRRINIQEIHIEHQNYTQIYAFSVHVLNTVFMQYSMALHGNTKDYKCID